MEKKNNTINAAAGLLSGYGVYKLTPIVCNKIRRATITRFLDTPLNAEQVAVYKQAGQDLFESKFKSKGYSILDASNPEQVEILENSLKSLEQHYDNKIASSKNFISRLYNKYMKRIVMKDNLISHNQVLEGTNAFYWVKKGAVVVNMEKKPTYLFHEFGHAIDYSNKYLAQSMSSLWRNKRFKNILFSTVMLTALLTNPKSKEDLEHASNREKFVQSVKKNSGLILGAYLLPSTLEECLANINGQKLAKEFVPKAHMPKITKTNLNSAIGYILYPLFVGGGMYLANKVRDKIAEGKLNCFS
ncbi:hypothetical protein J6A34_06230 [bacterium]|nr:hypothetical protein [bacterium]